MKRISLRNAPYVFYKKFCPSCVLYEYHLKQRVLEAIDKRQFILASAKVQCLSIYIVEEVHLVYVPQGHYVP